MQTNELRQLFLDYFKKQQHAIVPSSSLVPGNDPTLLFTNAGMVQFKDVFLGLEKRPFVRAASSQRCVRAGGKHNDLENVGYTARHHTFFEMLGNFSFGDYFKETAILFAWEFLTKSLKIPKEKLWVTVFREDDEAAKIWASKTDIDPQRILRCDEKDNFWSMGDTGPCGPCTEIYYDHGDKIPGGLPGTKEADGDRYVEIWNLVFMQYDRQADGKLIPLPKPSVDTGMGLERIAAVMQGVHSNYEIDIFSALINAAKKLTKLKNPSQNHLQVLADHIRSTSFLIIDGVIPSNEGRGYVLRRIIRRAIRHGYQIDMASPFFYQLVKPLVEQMGEAYPELRKSQALIEKVLQQEEQQFAVTLTQGMKLLEESLRNLSGKTIPGETVFRLYDTYGFPVDLTADIARERKLVIDEVGFEKEMAKQRMQSQANKKFTSEHLNEAAQALKDEAHTAFTGYEYLEEKHAKIIAILDQGIVLDKTPFYAESGGQVGDQGKIAHKNTLFVVQDTKKVGQHIVHYGEYTQGKFSVGDEVIATVDDVKRRATMLNHSATHLLHAALRKLLGEHVTQKGSLVAPDRLRFDFSHFSPMTANEIQQVEHLVNEQIRANHEVQVKLTSPEQAMKDGAMALFGEKYADEVRALKMGDFSHELCGGTHVKRTGDIGFFKIISETGVAAGIRRIEAVTGEGASLWLEQRQNEVSAKLQQSLDQQKLMQKQIEQLQIKLSHSVVQELVSKAKVTKNFKLVVESVDENYSKQLRDMAEQVKQQIYSGVVLLFVQSADRVNFALAVSKDLAEKLSASALLKELDIKGGGREDLVQGSCSKEQLDNLIDYIKTR